MKKNLTMLTDFYQLTMSNGLFKDGMGDREVVFDMFFRRVPDNGGYAIMCGLRSLIEYIQNLNFTEQDIDYLRSKNIFCEEFLHYLRDFKFTSTITAIPEGTPIFPNEPLVTVKGPMIQAQFIETMLLLFVNHQSLIATKASRIKNVAGDRTVLEFGTRRSHGATAAVDGAMAAYIGGADGTACVMCDTEYGIPATGTMAHSWIQFYGDDYTAFKKYAESYPNTCTLLVDTFDTLRSGVPNAIKVAKEVLEPMGCRLRGIRLDSGDLAYLSKKARKMLDEAGMTDCKIVASNSLDEHLISELNFQGAKIDIFGVGERLITARSEAVFGGVYKIGAVADDDGILQPRIKISENIEKITNPAYKEVYRVFDEDQGGYAVADLIALKGEVIDTTKPLTLYNPTHTWQQMTLKNYRLVPLHVTIFDKGELVYDIPSIEDTKKYCNEQKELLWEEVLRITNPHKYCVDLSDGIWDLKKELLAKHTHKK